VSHHDDFLEEAEVRETGPKLLGIAGVTRCALEPLPVGTGSIRDIGRIHIRSSASGRRKPDPAACLWKAKQPLFRGADCGVVLVTDDDRQSLAAAMTPRLLLDRLALVFFSVAHAHSPRRADGLRTIFTLWPTITMCTRYTACANCPISRVK